MISGQKRKDCVRLYREGILTIREIMLFTGIRSEQTIYRILDEAGIPRRPSRKVEHRAPICFDKETMDIIDRERPRNLSAWVCQAIKKAYAREDGK